MTLWFWIAIIINIISFGGMSYKSKIQKKSDRIYIPFYIISFIVALIFSKKIITGVIVAIILLLGNGFLWGIIWRQKIPKHLKENLSNKKNK